MLKGRFVTAEREGVCFCGAPIGSGERVLIIGIAGEKPLAWLKKDCASSLRISLADVFEKEKRRAILLSQNGRR